MVWPPPLYFNDQRCHDLDGNICSVQLKILLAEVGSLTVRVKRGTQAYSIYGLDKSAVLKVVGAFAVLATVYWVSLVPQTQYLQKVGDALCSGELNFAYATSRYTPPCTFTRLALS